MPDKSFLVFFVPHKERFIYPEKLPHFGLQMAGQFSLWPRRFREELFPESTRPYEQKNDRYGKCGRCRVYFSAKFVNKLCLQIG